MHMPTLALGRAGGGASQRESSRAHHATDANSRRVSHTDKQSPAARVLLVVDRSQASQRAIRYTATVLNCCENLTLYLAHVLPALPPELLEFGGAEDPNKEAALQARLRADQERWDTAAKTRAQQMLQRAEQVLTNGMPAAHFEIEYLEPENGQESADELLELGRRRCCSTIVVGHKSHSWFRELVGHDLVEELLRRGKGFAIWVIE